MFSIKKKKVEAVLSHKINFSLRSNPSFYDSLTGDYLSSTMPFMLFNLLKYTHVVFTTGNINLVFKVTKYCTQLSCSTPGGSALMFTWSLPRHTSVTKAVAVRAPADAP